MEIGANGSIICMDNMNVRRNDWLIISLLLLLLFFVGLHILSPDSFIEKIHQIDVQQNWVKFKKKKKTKEECASRPDK